MGDISLSAWVKCTRVHIVKLVEAWVKACIETLSQAFKPYNTLTYILAAPGPQLKIRGQILTLVAKPLQGHVFFSHGTSSEVVAIVPQRQLKNNQFLAEYASREKCPIWVKFSWK